MLDDGTRASSILEWESNIPADSYIRQMRSTSTWGGAIEIRALSEMSGRAIFVHDVRISPHQVIEFLPSNCTSKKPINLSWSGGHFEPLT